MDEMDGPKRNRNHKTLTFERSELMNRLRLFTTLLVTMGLVIGLGTVAFGQQWEKDEGFYLRIPSDGTPTQIPSRYSADYSIISGWTQARPDSLIYNNELNPDAAFLRFDLEYVGADVVLDSMLLTIRGNSTFNPNTDLKPINPTDVPGASEQIQSKNTGIQFYVEADPPTDPYPDEFDWTNIATGPRVLSSPLTDKTWLMTPIAGSTDQLWTAMFVFKTAIDIDADASHTDLNFSRIWVIVLSQGCHFDGNLKVKGLAPEDTFAVMMDSREHFFAHVKSTTTVLFPGTDIIVNDKIRPAWCDENAWEDDTPNPPYGERQRWSCATPVHGWDTMEGPAAAFITPPNPGMFTSDSLQVIRAWANDPGQCVDWCKSYVLLDTCTTQDGSTPGGWFEWTGRTDEKPDTLWMYEVLKFDPSGGWLSVSDAMCPPSGNTWAPGYDPSVGKRYGFTVFLGETCIDTIKIAPSHSSYGSQDLFWKDGWIVSVHLHLVDQAGNWNKTVHTHFTVDETPPIISDTQCSPGVPLGNSCRTSDTGQMIRWKVVDAIGDGCVCVVPKAGVDPDSLLITVNVTECTPDSRWPMFFTPAGQVDAFGQLIDPDAKFLTWDGEWLTFDPPDCFYKSGDWVCIDVKACDAVDIEWDENTYSCNFPWHNNDGPCYGTGAFHKNCTVLFGGPAADIPCFCVDTEPPTVVEDGDSPYPPDDSYTNDSCTPIMFEVADVICGDFPSRAYCGPGEVAGGWMKIKITDREGNKYHLDKDGFRIPGHGANFNPGDTNAGGWMDITGTGFVHPGVGGQNDTVIYNPQKWIDDYQPPGVEGVLPFFDGDHVCVRVLPYDNAICCDSPANIAENPFTWEFNIDEFFPFLIAENDTMWEHCCQIDSFFVNFTLSDIPGGNIDEDNWWNDGFNCLQSGINACSTYIYFVVKGDTLPFGPGNEKIYVCEDSRYFRNKSGSDWSMTRHQLDRVDCDHDNLVIDFSAHIDSMFARELYDTLQAQGVNQFRIWAHFCDSTTVPWKNINCQLCDPCPVLEGQLANCDSGYFDVVIAPDMEFERNYWSNQYHPEPGEDGVIDESALNWDGNFYYDNETIPINAPVIGAAINTNIDHFFFDTARLTVWVTRDGVRRLAYDGFYQEGCDECDLWGWYREFCVNDGYWYDGHLKSFTGTCHCTGPFQVCCGGDLTPEEINVKLVLPTVWDLSRQPVPLRDALNNDLEYYYPEYLHPMACDEVEAIVSAWSDYAIWGSDEYLDSVCEECPTQGGHHCACYDGTRDYRYEDHWTWTYHEEVGPVVEDMNLHTIKGYEDISSCNLNPHQEDGSPWWNNFQLWIEGIHDVTSPDCELAGFDCEGLEAGGGAESDAVKSTDGDKIENKKRNLYAFLMAKNTPFDESTKFLHKDRCGKGKLPDYICTYLTPDPLDPLDLGHWTYRIDLERWEGVSCWFKGVWDCVWLDVPHDTLYALVFAQDNWGNWSVTNSMDFGEYLILDNVKPEPNSVKFAYDIFGEDLVPGECDPDLTAENVATLNMPGTYYVFIDWNDHMDVTSEEFSVKFEDENGTVWTVRGVTRDDYPEDWPNPKDRGEEINVTTPGWIGSDDGTWVGVMELDDQRMEQGEATMMLYRFRDTACNKMKPWYCKFKLFKGCDPPEICEPDPGDYISGFAADDSCDNVDSYAMLCAFFNHPLLLTNVLWQFDKGEGWIDIAATDNGMMGDCKCYQWNTLAAAAEGEMATIDLRVITECGPMDTDTSDVVVGVIVDNVPPVPTITNPVEGQVVTADYLALEATIVEECIATNGTEWHFSLDEGDTWEAIADPDHWEPENTLAEYLLRLRVYDCAGLVGCDAIHFFWRAITVGFERGGRMNPTLEAAFEDAVLDEPNGLDWPGTWKLDEGTVDDLDLIPITTYVYDPACDLWWQPCDVRGELYPGDKLFVTYRVGTGTPIDSINLHIPAKGSSNHEKNRMFRAGGPNIGEWSMLTNIGGFDYYGYNWTIFDESRFDDGLWELHSIIHVGGTAFPDTAFIILDSEDPQYTITYNEADGDQALLPTIVHPTFGEIPVTNKQLVNILVTVDQTVVDDLPGTGRLWSWMNIFIFAPGELVDIDGVPACGDALFPCGPGEEFDRWMNEPPFSDTLDYHYRWNVLNADGTSEGVATVFIKGRDTAGNIVDIAEGQAAGNIGLEIYIDITAPVIPDETLLTICDDGTVTGAVGAVGQDHWAQPLKVTLYGNSLLTDVLAEFWANSDGSFNATLDPAPTAGTEIFVTAMDHATNESNATSVMATTCDVPFSYGMNTGWNMRSVPVEPADATLSTLFPDAQNMWKHDGNYQPAVVAATGEGYWLLYGNDDVEEITGLPVRSYTRTLNAGWNILGSLIETVPVSSIIDVAAGSPATLSGNCLAGDVWGWNGAYEVAFSVEAGYAYWVFALYECEISLSIPEAGAAARAPVAEPRLNPLWESVVTVNSATESKALHFGGNDNSSADYDARYDVLAPPPAPAMDLQAYFTGDAGVMNFYRDVRGLQDNLWTLHVNAENAMTLTWDVTAIPQEMAARIRANGAEVDMRAQSSISLTKGPHDLDITVKLIPKAFDLAQNYPNPFNPETNISYGLPEDANVVLKVYNVLGQEIRTLVDGQQSAGFFTVMWDGTNDFGEMVSTGVYIYRITAGQYAASKRMVLVK